MFHTLRFARAPGFCVTSMKYAAPQNVLDFNGIKLRIHFAAAHKAPKKITT
jgi:hypothetical protein